MVVESVGYEIAFGDELGKVLCEVAAVVSWASLKNMWRISWLWFKALDKFHTHSPKMQIFQEYYIHWEYRDWILVLLVPLLGGANIFIFLFLKIISRFKSVENKK